MADQGVKASGLPVWANSVSGNVSVIIVTRNNPVPNTYIVDLSVVYSNSQFDIVLGDSNKLSAYTLIVRSNVTPTNSTSTTVAQGTVFWDTSFFYVATANNHVKRAALSDF